MKAINWLQERFSDYWLFFSTLLAVGGLLLLYLGTQKHVTVVINGKHGKLLTHARTVGSALAAVDIRPSPGDELSPAFDQRLIDQQWIIYNQSRPVILDVDGKIQTGKTTNRLPANILVQAGILLYPGDTVDLFNSPNQRMPTSIDEAQWLRVDRGHPITLNIDGEVHELSSSAATLGEALWEHEILIYQGDTIQPEAGTPLDRRIEATLNRSASYVIEVDGQTISRRGVGSDVGEVLSQAGINLVGLDYAIPDVKDPPPTDGFIRVVRVVEKLLVELEPVEFETVYQPAEQLELDTTEVLEPGTFGVRSKSIRVRYEDGEEVGRIVEDAVLAVEPKNRVIGYGTKIVVRTLDTGQGTIEYWRAIPIYATSYSPCNLGVPWCGTLTASGKVVDRGVIGVIRSWYRLMRGWGVFVPGYGPGTFEDIGAGIAGRDWIDLGFRDDNFEPWHQWTTLYFLTPVPPLDSIPWILP